MLSIESKDLIRYFVEERQKIYLKKKNGESFPWSKDKIFQEKRFCNALRELDKETIWIRKNWLEPLKDNDKLWFAPFLFRIFNLGRTFDSLQEKGLRLITNFLEEKDKFCDHIRDKNRIFSPAYMITTHGMSCENKGEFLIQHDLVKVFEKEDQIKEALESNSFQKSFKKLRELRLPGFGGFILYQVLLDLSYTRYLINHSDRYEWTYIGGGSAQGLNLLFGRDKFTILKEKQALYEYKIIMEEMNNFIDFSLFKNDFEELKKDKFNIHDIEFMCCEVRKYLEAKMGIRRKKYHLCQ